MKIRIKTIKNVKRIYTLVLDSGEMKEILGPILNNPNDIRKTKITKFKKTLYIALLNHNKDI